jgi:hypothetical protein
MHLLSWVAFVALEKHGGNEFLVTLGGFCRLDGLELLVIVEHLVVIVWWLA